MSGIIVILAGILLGFVIGYFSKGINITINHKDKAEIPVTTDGKPVYNEDYSALLPPEVKQYYEENHGYIK